MRRLAILRDAKLLQHHLVAIVENALDEWVLDDYVILLKLLIDKVSHSDLYHRRLSLLPGLLILHGDL